MKTKKISFTIHHFEELEEMPAADRILVERARTAAGQAYSPYSNYSVGAAIRLENGEVLMGNNQENASFPAGICAEQVVLAFANANWPAEAVTNIAISAINTRGERAEIIRPCGICRQVMVEVEKKFSRPMRVIMDGQAGIEVVDQANYMLPLTFDGLDHLIAKG
ncbi:MAG TPA: cytidine deaminase [Saprospiraceae bacterium]|nr:cytidine deaminase [Saprospiraceae bacterium]